MPVFLLSLSGTLLGLSDAWGPDACNDHWRWMSTLPNSFALKVGRVGKMASREPHLRTPRNEAHARAQDVRDPEVRGSHLRAQPIGLSVPNLRTSPNIASKPTSFCQVPWVDKGKPKATRPVLGGVVSLLGDAICQCLNGCWPLWAKDNLDNGCRNLLGPRSNLKQNKAFKGKTTIEHSQRHLCLGETGTFLCGTFVPNLDAYWNLGLGPPL